MKLLLIDSNKTIENHADIKKNRSILFDNISKEYDIDSSVISDFYYSFQNKYGDIFWEYHPIFWRSLSNDCLNKSDESTISNLFNIFLKYYEENIKLFDDTISFLEACKNKYTMALVANGNALRVSRFVNKFNLCRYFDDIVISGETPFKKPESFMYEYVLKRRNIKISDTIMIGDRYDTDIIGAKKLGIRTVLLRRNLSEKNKNYSSPSYMPDFSTCDLNEVEELLKCLNGSSKTYDLIYDFPSKESKAIQSALILAGGKGSRLGDIGKITQKCMLDVRGKPLLYFMINSLKNAGCNNIVIVVNHLSEQIKEYFGDGEKFGIKITYLEGQYISTYDAVYHALPYLSDCFYYCHGNIVFEERLLESLWKKHIETNSNVISTVKDETTVTHAKLILDGDSIADLSIHPKETDPKIFNYTFMGAAIYQKELFYKFSDDNMSGMTEKNIIQLLDNDIPTYAVEYNNKWWHIESEEDYNKIKNKYYWEVQF